jgi:AP2-associated kinase
MTGGGIIDLLNKRLRDRLKEAEILNIFTDVCEVSAHDIFCAQLTSRPLQPCTPSKHLYFIEISR